MATVSDQFATRLSLKDRSTVSTLLDLPRELRQRIFSEIVHPEDRQVANAWPDDAKALLCVCRGIRAEMEWVLNSWAPTWLLLNPRNLAGPQPLSIGQTKVSPTQGRLCIRVFNDVTSDAILRPNAIWVSPQRGLVSAWWGAVPQLPKTIKKVLLDITPAPGWQREGRQYSLHRLILEKTATRTFLEQNKSDMISLVKRIHERYAGDVTITLIGKLARKSEHVIDDILSTANQDGVHLQFKGEYITRADVILPSIDDAVHDLTPKRRPKNATDWPRSLRLAPLRKVYWRGQTRMLFLKICDERGLEVGNELLLQMAEFMVSGKEARLEMPPAGNLHRALAHNMAKDMGLTSESEGNNENRHVVVSQRPEYLNIVSPI